jgi:hypothetical protein
MDLLCLCAGKRIVPVASGLSLSKEAVTACKDLGIELIMPRGRGGTHTAASGDANWTLSPDSLKPAAVFVPHAKKQSAAGLRQREESTGKISGWARRGGGVVGKSMREATN